MAEEGQQHPLKVYYWIWALLFVVSFFSYMVDYLQIQGMLRWTLILIFMFVKAGFIIAIFMHMQWERLALKLAILGPPVAIIVLIALMALEGGKAATNLLDRGHRAILRFFWGWAHADSPFEESRILQAGVGWLGCRESGQAALGPASRRDGRRMIDRSSSKTPSTAIPRRRNGSRSNQTSG